MPLNHLPEALEFVSQSGEFKLLRREIVNGSPTFLTRTEFIRAAAWVAGIGQFNIWTGANDSLPRRAEMISTEKPAAFIAPTVEVGTVERGL